MSESTSEVTRCFVQLVVEIRPRESTELEGEQRGEGDTTGFENRLSSRSRSQQCCLSVAFIRDRDTERFGRCLLVVVVSVWFEFLITRRVTAKHPSSWVVRERFARFYRVNHEPRVATGKKTNFHTTDFARLVFRNAACCAGDDQNVGVTAPCSSFFFFSWCSYWNTRFTYCEFWCGWNIFRNQFVLSVYRCEQYVNVISSQILTIDVNVSSICGFSELGKVYVFTIKCGILV